jgi:hypothetical protein
MMVLNLPRDDLGVLRLQQSNAAKAYAPIASVAATTAAGYQPSPTLATPVVAPDERRHGERRQAHERRGQGRQAAVLLDTRSHHERRTHDRRRRTTAQGRSFVPQGIDLRI